MSSYFRNKPQSSSDAFDEGSSLLDDDAISLSSQHSSSQQLTLSDYGATASALDEVIAHSNGSATLASLDDLLGLPEIELSKKTVAPSFPSHLSIPKACTHKFQDALSKIFKDDIDGVADYFRDHPEDLTKTGWFNSSTVLIACAQGGGATTMEYLTGALKARSWLRAPEGIINQHSKREKGKKGPTALMIAAERGHLEVLKILLNNGADYKLKCSYGIIISYFSRFLIVIFITRRNSIHRGCGKWNACGTEGTIQNE